MDQPIIYHSYSPGLDSAAETMNNWAKLTLLYQTKCSYFMREILVTAGVAVIHTVEHANLVVSDLRDA
jgi:hypothetical protein